MFQSSILDGVPEVSTLLDSGSTLLGNNPTQLASNQETLLLPPVQNETKSLTMEYFVRLFPSQAPNLMDMIEIAKKTLVQTNSSDTGTGKTWLSMALALVLNCDLFYVGPKIMIPIVEESCQANGVVCYGFGYEALKGTSKGVNHIWLTRTDRSFRPTAVLSNTLDGKYSTISTVKDEQTGLMKQVEEIVQTDRGLLIVIDEVHKLKNIGTERQMAVRALIQELVRANDRAIKAKRSFNSRALLLSATPADKKEQSKSFVQLYGLTFQSDYYEYDRSTRTTILTGIKEVWNNARRLERTFDPEHQSPVVDALSLNGVTPQNCSNLLYELVQRVLKPYTFTAMPPLDISFQQYCFDFYAVTPEEDADALARSVSDLANATRFRRDGEVDLRNANWGAITNAIRSGHQAMQNTMARIAIQALQTDPNLKVILFVAFNQQVDFLREKLSNYDPLVLTGSINNALERKAIIDSFNAPSTVNRLLIANFLVGSVGLSLDDRDGRYPRLTIMLPTFYFIDMVQAAGRCYRRTSKSDPTVYMLYSRDFPEQLSILQAIARKKQIVKSMRAQKEIEETENEEKTDETVKALFKEVKFPGDYDIYTEKKTDMEDISAITDRIKQARAKVQ